MDALAVLGLVGAIGLAALAVPFLVRPRLVEKLGVTALDGNGWLELRGIYGGLLLALGLTCLVTRQPYAFLTAGVALLAFAAVGLASLALDHPRVPQAMAVNAAHALLGLLLFAGFWGW